MVFIGLSLGCEEESRKALPGSTGKAGEVVVVMEQKYWNGDLGTHIKNTLAKEFPALPQPEPLFHLVHIPKSSFKGLFLTHRNILIFSIGKDKDNSGLIRQVKNKWATSQIVISVSAPSEAKCLELLTEDKSQLERTLSVTERMRLRQKFNSIRNKNLALKLEGKFGLSLAVPTDYVIASEEDNFIWFRKETPEISQGIFVYTYQKGNGALNDINTIIAKRDSAAMNNIPGPLDGSYMGTMMDYPASTTSLDFKGTHAIETRGLWKVVGDFMGGPFLSLTLLSEDQSKVICIDGYVYAPKYDKRNYLRQVEAILYSLKVGE